MYINKVQFPITPGKLTQKINNQNKTINLIDEGEVNLIKAPGLADITIDELLLPVAQIYPFAKYRRVVSQGIYHRRIEFQNADYYLGKLEAWKNSKKPVCFKLVRVGVDGQKILKSTNLDVTIEDYEIIEDAERYGMDVAVKLSMKEYRYWGAKKLSINNSGKKKTAKKKKARKSKEPVKLYTVKKGDTLMKIAKKQLNDASLWRSIYALNKKTIEADARKHGKKSSSNGHWIYPGTKLKLFVEEKTLMGYQEFIGF